MLVVNIGSIFSVLVSGNMCNVGMELVIVVVIGVLFNMVFINL